LDLISESDEDQNLDEDSKEKRRILKKHMRKTLNERKGILEQSILNRNEYQKMKESLIT
jgi:hypothetical protein